VKAGERRGAPLMALGRSLASRCGVRRGRGRRGVIEHVGEGRGASTGQDAAGEQWRAARLATGGAASRHGVRVQATGGTAVGAARSARAGHAGMGTGGRAQGRVRARGGRWPWLRSRAALGSRGKGKREGRRREEGKKGKKRKRGEREMGKEKGKEKEKEEEKVKGKRKGKT
jgi:hypothetical protein